MIGAPQGFQKMPPRIITDPVCVYAFVCVCVCVMPMRPGEQQCVRGSSRRSVAQPRMSGEVKWGVINLNEVQLFSHLLIIAG